MHVVLSPQGMPVQIRSIRFTHTLLAAAIVLAAAGAAAADAAQGIEQALQAAQQDKRGITLYVHGQTIGGAVTRVEPASGWS